MSKRAGETQTEQPMARNRARLSREFLARHPLCIFCGGIEPATTLDHVPSRQTFHLREWPEGYVFPACGRCNSATKDAEQVMAMISRMAPNAKTPAERAEVKWIIRAVANNYPGLLGELRANPDQVDAYLAKPWLSKMRELGVAAREPLSLRGPLMGQCAEAFARKLFTALHHKEFGKIITPSGGVLWRWYSNAQRLDNAMPDELINLLGGRPSIQRTRRDLSDQFTYGYAKAIDAELTGYFATFRQSFAMLGFVDLDANQLRDGLLPEVDVLGPLGVAAPDAEAAQ